MTTRAILDPDDPDGPGDDTLSSPAEVVDLDRARARRTPASSSDATDDDTDDGTEVDGFDDAESVDDSPEPPGRPVDPDDEIPRAVYARQLRRKPILPSWARSGAAMSATVRHTVRDAGYVAAYHGLRLPKYAGKVALYAPAGLARTATRLVYWATAEEGNWALRQSAASRNDPETWLRLDRQRQRQAVWRWTLLALLTPPVLALAVVLLVGPWPAPVRLAGALVLAAGLARLGRPADRPITDRVTEGQRYRKLTAELVRRALTSLQMPGINSAVAKDPNAITFPVEIHRDGPGHLAVVDLPHGVEATEVVARRGKLASALRLPLDQVWPEPATGHTGRLALWVGYEPASQMTQPPWPLLAGGKVDVFGSFPFVTTPRLDVLAAELMFRNWLIGGQPGSGKTFTLRLLLLAAALDPRVELRGYNLKGTGDFRVLEPICAEYGNGFDDDTLAACVGMFEWLYEECRRRAKRIEHYARLGKAPENKVTPELASLKGSGLHPLVVFVDEIQELFMSKWGKEVGDLPEKIIKLGRALGVILLIGTQIPDKDSLPTGITRNVNTRMCHSVADQTANDMILGTSAYKQGYRATVFEPVAQAGWGILAGLGTRGARRAFPVDNTAAERVVHRAIALRVKAGTMPNPEEQTRDTGPTFDLLADLARIWPPAEKAVWNETLCGLLAELRPDVYAGWEPAQLTGALKQHQAISVADVGRRIDGKPVTRRGIKHADLLTAIAERNRQRVAD